MDVREAERRAGRVQRLALAAVAAIAAAAVVSELRKPPGERRWHGRVGGLVPYDFRPPTVERLRRTWWSPEEGRLLVGTAFGVGWDVNLARLARLLRP